MEFHVCCSKNQLGEVGASKPPDSRLQISREIFIDPMILETADFEAVGSSRWVGLEENFPRHKNSKIS